MRMLCTPAHLSDHRHTQSHVVSLLTLSLGRLVWMTRCHQPGEDGVGGAEEGGGEGEGEGDGNSNLTARKVQTSISSVTYLVAKNGGGRDGPQLLK